MNNILLLRDNKQTGPHTLEELVKSGLKPFDLIWIEGRSAAWAYASEIAIFKPYLTQVTEPQQMEPKEVSTASEQMVHQSYLPPETEISATQKAPATKKVYVSLPPKKASPVVTATKDPDAVRLEQKAEELRKRAQSYARETPARETPVTDTRVTPNAETVHTKYSRNISDLESEYTSWMYKQKTKKKNNVSPRTVGIGIVVLLIVIGGYVIATKYGSNSGDTNPGNTRNELTAKGNSSPVAHEIETPEPQTDQARLLEAPAATEPVDGKRETDPVAPAPNKNKNLRALPRQAAIKTALPSTKRAEAQKDATEAEPVNNPPVNSRPGKDDQVATTPPQKSKTFGEKLSGFFKKLKGKKEASKNDVGKKDEAKKNEAKNEEDKPLVQPQRTTMDPGSHERKARRRGDQEPSSAPAGTADLAEFIEITSNEPSENWMLGIHGLKLTVRNTSDEPVKTAVVEVRYYNEQKELLETKTVKFANIPPGKSATSAVPDHRLAERTDYRVVSAGN